MVVRLTLGGSTAKTQAWLKRMQSANLYSDLERLAERGVAALEAATPKDTGLTASSWSYEIENSGGKTTIYWLNSNKTDTGIPIAILLQYGHGTGTGGYVQGRDYINPAIQSVMDEIANDVWKKVTIG